MNVGQSYWRGRRVLVTGAGGFMGSHLLEALLGLEARVTALVRGTSTCGTSKFDSRNISHLLPRLEDIIATDIASSDALQLILEAQPEVIFHLAAIAYVPYSFEHPREVHNANVVGTLNVLDAARSLKALHRVVITSSSEVYGTAQAPAIDENHPLNPTSPYAASKAAADRYAYAYHETYHLPVAIIRPFNYFGPRHTYDVIPKFIDMVLEGREPTIYGTGEQSRDLTYVSDIANAFLLIGWHERAVGEVINFGTGRDVSVNEITAKIIAAVGSHVRPVYVERRVAEVERLTCDYGKARRLLGWEPQVSIDQGIRLNVEYRRAHPEGLHLA